MVLPSKHDFLQQLHPEECPICCYPFQSPICTSCGHYFCLECATKWFKSSSTCPSCRTVLYERLNEDGTGRAAQEVRDVQDAINSNINEMTLSLQQSIDRLRHFDFGRIFEPVEISAIQRTAELSNSRRLRNFVPSAYNLNDVVRLMPRELHCAAISAILSRKPDAWSAQEDATESSTRTWVVFGRSIGEAVLQMCSYMQYMPVQCLLVRLTDHCLRRLQRAGIRVTSSVNHTQPSNDTITREDVDWVVRETCRHFHFNEIWNDNPSILNLLVPRINVHTGHEVAIQSEFGLGAVKMDIRGGRRVSQAPMYLQDIAAYSSDLSGGVKDLSWSSFKTFLFDAGILSRGHDFLRINSQLVRNQENFEQAMLDAMKGIRKELVVTLTLANPEEDDAGR